MFAVGLGTTWLGYSLFYYGLTQVQSGNWGYFDLILPSRAVHLASIARDDGSARTPPPSLQTKITKSVVSDLLHGAAGATPVGAISSGVSILKRLLP